MSSGHSILIVDGNPGFASLLKESLEQEGGCLTTLATNGDDALQALSAATYDLAIIDLGLDEPDGADLARTIRQQVGDLRLMLIPIQGELSQSGRCRGSCPLKSPRLIQYVGAARSTSETMTVPHWSAVARRSPVGLQTAVSIQFREGSS